MIAVDRSPLFNPEKLINDCIIFDDDMIWKCIDEASALERAPLNCTKLHEILCIVLEKTQLCKYTNQML